MFRGYDNTLIQQLTSYIRSEMGVCVSNNLPKGAASRRAPKACESCRTRKVRCDVTRMKAPCTNCKLDNKECVVPASKRRHVGDRVLWSSSTRDKHNPKSPICDAIIDFGDIQKSPTETSDVGPISYAETLSEATFDVFDWSTDDQVPPYTLAQAEKEGLANVFSDEATMKVDFFAPYPSPTQTNSDDQSPFPGLPSYIADLPQELSPEDLGYMQQRGCFTIPDDYCRDELLRSYAKWIHPFLPMLDLTNILTAVAHDNATSQPISLLLFQSIMLAAATFCNIGAEDRKTTERILYERCKILHDVGAETDRLRILQSAILMSFWDGDNGGLRDSYYWIGIATLQANTIGLYQDPVASSACLRRQRELKRTWWSLLIRDRLLAVTMRRPVQNQAYRLEAPVLHMEDFENEDLLNAMQDWLPTDEVNSTTLDTLASCCMALGQLSEYIDQILAAQYSVQRDPEVHNNHAQHVCLVPKSSGIKWTEIMNRGQELQNWYGYLPVEVQQFEPGVSELEGAESDMVKVHKGLLAGYYSMALMTLYRPLLSVTTRTESENKARRKAMRIVFQAARSITETYGVLYAKDMLSYLPDTAIAALEPAMVTHLLYSMSNINRIRDMSCQRFYLCWRILLQLGDIHCIANTTITMINAAAQRLKKRSDSKPTVPESAQLDELGLLTHHEPRSKIAVPFIGVVADQRESEIGYSWEHSLNLQRDHRQVGRIDRVEHIEAGDIDSNTSLDAALFEQLVCLEAIEDSIQF